MATFEEMYGEVRKSIGNRTEIDTEIKCAVNDAMVDIAMMFRMRTRTLSKTIILQNGINAYELDAAVLDVISVRNVTDDTPVHKGDYLEFATLDNDNSDDYAVPTKWFVDGNYLYLYNATPDDSEDEFIYRYLDKPPDMVNSGDVFPLPREWVRPTKLLAKSYVFELLGQGQEAVQAYQQMVAIVSARKPTRYWEQIHAQESSMNFGPAEPYREY